MAMVAVEVESMKRHYKIALILMEILTNQEVHVGMATANDWKYSSQQVDTFTVH